MFFDYVDKAIDLTALTYFLLSSIFAMTADNLEIFFQADNCRAAAKLGYMISIPCRYAANWRLAERFSH